MKILLTTFQAVSNHLKNMDPLKGEDFSSVGAILSRLGTYALVFSGLGLLVMLLMGGFQMLTAADNPDQAEQGKKTLTYAIIGFVVIFTAYWITEIIEIMFGVDIFGQTGQKI